MKWFEVLQAVQKLHRAGRALTSGTVADKTGLPTSTASAWLGKFVRWGYLLRAGSESGDRHWVRVYSITSFGKRYKRGKE